MSTVSDHVYYRSDSDSNFNFGREMGAKHQKQGRCLKEIKKRQKSDCRRRDQQFINEKQNDTKTKNRKDYDKGDGII